MSFKASRTPSRDNIGKIEVIGLDGPMITASEFLIASTTPSLGATSEIGYPKPPGLTDA